MPKESFNLTPHTAGVFDAGINDGDVVVTARSNINNASSAEIERLLTLIINFDYALSRKSEAEQGALCLRVLERGLMQVVKEELEPDTEFVDFLDVLRGEAYQLLDPIRDAGHLDKAVWLDPPHDVVP